MNRDAGSSALNDKALVKLGYSLKPTELFSISYEKFIGCTGVVIRFDERDKVVLKISYDERGQGRSPMTPLEIRACVDILDSLGWTND